MHSVWVCACVRARERERERARELEYGERGTPYCVTDWLGICMYISISSVNFTAS